MADIAWSDVVAFAPELSTFDATAQTIVLADANTAFVVSKFGGEASPRLQRVRILFAAHAATISRQGSGAPAGPVTSESAGNISRSYASLSGQYAGSSYADELNRLIRSSTARLPLVS